MHALGFLLLSAFLNLLGSLLLMKLNQLTGLANG